MTEKKLSKKVKRIIAPGCGIKVIEEDDGIILEITPLPAERLGPKGKICAPIFDEDGNIIHCKAIDCGAGCHLCGIEYPDGYVEYWCNCGPCPPHPHQSPQP
jgi:hypothetical protein